MFLQGHEVEHGGHTPLPSALPLRVEGVQGLAVSKLHLNQYSVFAVVTLIQTGTSKGNKYIIIMTYDIGQIQRNLSIVDTTYNVLALGQEKILMCLHL